MKTVALIVAAGSSTRLAGDVPKQFREVCGRPVLSWTISRFEAAESIDDIVLVVAEEFLLHATQAVVDPCGFAKVSKIVIGGETRRESVLNGLKALPISTKLVAIHDGARPLVSPEDIDRVVDAAASERAAILAVKAVDTVKRARQGFILSTLERDSLYLAQTPQVFQYDLIMEAHNQIDDIENQQITDDASLVEARGFKVRIIEPSTLNFKVTTADDLHLAESVLNRESHE
ncbi:MAG: 2-C-methyl-D-erythritol 4-phosphate cytidylyltransferase [candidate division Zixibacteria bacterium]|nr:2-C-methyl-D-erythritol 4-phosphate cytidylyltransferase [candidate division Zixibacteria bacterium]